MLFSHQDQATEVECVSCHGNLEYRAMPYLADNRNPIKNLIACAELGETLPADYVADPEVAAECGRLGRGRFVKGKFDGKWHYVPQVVDTVRDVGQGAGGGPTWPNGTPVYTLNASIFHGRFNQDLNDGAGPCPNGNIQNCFKDQANNQFPVTQGFSHLGTAAQHGADQGGGGLECYTCHATWVNACFGCHLTLRDNDGNQIIRDFARWSGEYGYGVIAQADFTYIDPLAIQMGINSEGKISQMLPETKMMVRHVDYQNNDYFGTRVIVNNDANLVYNVYRDRAGYGLRQYATEVTGFPPGSDGQQYEQYAQMDDNAGQGYNQMMPHSIQRSWGAIMDCTSCHMDVNQANADAILAKYGANPNGFANVSAYLTALDGLNIVRNNTNDAVTVNAAAGFRLDANIDPNGYSVDQQTDWCVRVADGFPLCYNNHPMKQTGYGLGFNPQYARTWPTLAPMSGPINVYLLNKLQNEILVNNANVQFKQGRR
jgi:hypothetical protein